MSTVSRNLGSSCLRMKPTITRQRLSPLVELRPVLAEPFGIPCQGGPMFIRLCAFLVQATSPNPWQQPVQENCHSRSFPKQRLMATLLMEIKSVWPRPMSRNTSTQALSPNGWSWGRLSVQRLRAMWSGKSLWLVIWLSSWVGKPVAMVSAVLLVRPRYRRSSRWKRLALRCKRGMPSRSARFNGSSAMVM